MSPTSGKSFGLLFNRWWTLTALAVSLLMLATAWGFQLFGGLSPCHLCLKQRDIYWIAFGVALVASIWALFTGAKGPPRVFAFILFAVFTTGAAIATYHAGVEYHWWAGPASCSTGGDDISIDRMAAFIAGAVDHAPMCDVVPWSLFGVSMAGYNALISAVLAVLSLLASLRFRRKRR